VDARKQEGISRVKIGICHFKSTQQFQRKTLNLNGFRVFLLARRELALLGETLNKCFYPIGTASFHLFSSLIEKI